MFTVTVFMPTVGGLCSVNLIEHRHQIDIEPPGTVLLCGTFTALGKASLARSQITALLNQSADLSRLSEIVDDTYPFTVVGVRGQGQHAFSFSIKRMQVICKGHDSLVIVGAYASLPEAETALRALGPPPLHPQRVAVIGDA